MIVTCTQGRLNHLSNCSASPRLAGMQLYCWRGTAPNFGDELNTLLWPRLLPDFFDDDPAELFLGIGSVLEARHACHGA